MNEDLKNYYKVGEHVIDNLTINCGKIAIIKAVTTRTITLKHKGFKVKHSFTKLTEDVLQEIKSKLQFVNP